MADQYYVRAKLKLCTRIPFYVNLRDSGTTQGVTFIMLLGVFSPT